MRLGTRYRDLAALDRCLASESKGLLLRRWAPSRAGNPLSKSKGISQHELGQAADISFSKVRGQANERQQFLDISTWIRDNILFDQLILEYRDYDRIRKVATPKQVWIHISYKTKGQNRNQVLTMNNDSVVAQGLALVD